MVFSAWIPVTPLAVILGYWIIATVVLVAPIVAPLLREAWHLP